MAPASLQTLHHDAGVSEEAKVVKIIRMCHYHKKICCPSALLKQACVKMANC
jgi:hypothetical protein